MKGPSAHRAPRKLCSNPPSQRITGAVNSGSAPQASASQYNANTQTLWIFTGNKWDNTKGRKVSPGTGTWHSINVCFPFFLRSHLKESQGGREMDWEFGVGRRELLYLEWISNEE